MLVVGTGLLGTSAGLALMAVGIQVWLTDTHSPSLAVAAGRGAGRAWDGLTPVDLVLVAVPPRATATELARYQSLDIAMTYTHVASVQSQVQSEVEASDLDLSSIVGGHPMAGRETAGPASADPDLFRGRPWCVCPSSASSAAAVQHVNDLARAVGAVPTLLSAAQHDEWVALVSHLPQIASSALAAGLHDPDLADARALALAGPGLVDTTRIAASDPDLWTDVLTANAVGLVPLVAALVGRLGDLQSALEAPPSAERDTAVRGLLAAGVAGRARVPVKRGADSAAFGAVRVELADRPGELARLLVEAAQVGVNVEDLRVDHLPGRPRGVVSLSVEPAQQALLAQGLAEAGWTLQPSTGGSSA